MSRATSIDVAVEAGVSQATVARAFSRPELVAEGTRRRVEEAADRLGYRPNAIARSLKSSRTNIVGAIVPASGEFWLRVLAALSAELADRGRQLLLFSFDDAEAVDDVIAAVDQYRLDGLIMASTSIAQQQVVRVAPTGLPIVAFNQPAVAGLVPSVSVDNAAGGATVAEHLVARDCRDVLFVGGVESASTDQLRYAGAARALGAYGVACPYLSAGAFSYDAGHAIAAELLARGPLPDGLMVAADEVAFGLIDGLEAAGVAVPDDVLVTGFDGLPQAAWAGYDLTTLVQPVDALASAAVDRLLTDAAPDADGVVPGTLRIGRSTTPAGLVVENSSSPDRAER